MKKATVPLRFGVSGDVGSFSEEAALLYTVQKRIKASFVYLIDMEGVLGALERKEIERGILPVVNLHTGLVKQAFAAMGKHLFTPIDELWHPIQQCLQVLPGIETHQITSIASHPQGLYQCEQYLQKKFNHAKRIEWCDTAKAAKELAEGHLPSNTAVIAPERCAKQYGLKVVERNIQDKEPNLTAFIIVKNEL